MNWKHWNLPSRFAGVTTLALATAACPSFILQLPDWTRESLGRHSPLEGRQPWWNFPTRKFVASQLITGAQVFEFGSGASTLWLLDRHMQVRSIEHDEQWFRMLVAAEPRAAAAVRLIDTSNDFSDYVRAISCEVDASLDLVIVDGRERVKCGLSSIRKLRPGGLLLLDDSERERYRPLHDALSHWEVHHLKGLKGGDWAPRETSIWRKPVV